MSQPGKRKREGGLNIYTPTSAEPNYSNILHKLLRAVKVLIPQNRKFWMKIVKRHQITDRYISSSLNIIFLSDKISHCFFIWGRHIYLVSCKFNGGPLCSGVPRLLLHMAGQFLRTLSGYSTFRGGAIMRHALGTPIHVVYTWLQIHFSTVGKSYI